MDVRTPTLALLMGAAACPPAWASSARAAQATPIPRLVAKLRSADPKEADAALDELLAAGEQGKKYAAGALTALLRRRRHLREEARKPLAAPFRFLADQARTRTILQGLHRLAAAGNEAVAFAFDDQRYPVPARAHRGWMAGRDYQKGQVLLEGRVEVAVGIFNRVESELVRLFGLRVTARSPGGGGFGRAHLRGALKDGSRPLRVLKYNFTDAEAAWAQIGSLLAARFPRWEQADRAYQHAKAMAEKAGVEPPKEGAPAELPPIVPAAAALFAGEYEQALRLRPRSGPAARIFDVLVRRHVLVRNAEARGSWSRREKEMMHLLNLYRLSLDLPPLVANAKLYAAAREHSEWQSRHGRMTHVRPEADKRTFAQRCRAQGYGAARAENISGWGGADAIWSWRCDAAHHRNLISGGLRAAAVALSGRFATYDAGTAIDAPHLAALLKPVPPQKHAPGR
jgi:hypothetical protein